jgi:CheY-like chemotaxis protein
MKILIAEDSATTRQFLASFVQDPTREIIQVENGSDAIEAFSEHQPDWVLMDIGMEPVDGLEATRSILSDYPHARIVIVTAFGGETVRRKAMEAGAYGYVQKENLLELREILAQH